MSRRAMAEDISKAQETQEALLALVKDVARRIPDMPSEGMGAALTGLAQLLSTPTVSGLLNPARFP